MILFAISFHLVNTDLAYCTQFMLFKIFLLMGVRLVRLRAKKCAKKSVKWCVAHETFGSSFNSNTIQLYIQHNECRNIFGQTSGVQNTIQKIGQRHKLNCTIQYHSSLSAFEHVKGIRCISFLDTEVHFFKRI